MNIGLINTYSYNNIGDAAIYTALSQLLNNNSVYSTLEDPTAQAPSAIHYRESLSNCEAYISVGGDIFNNSRPWFITRNFLQNLQQLGKYPSSTVLFGQSIPSSCTGLSLNLLSKQLKQLSGVVLRDQQSYNTLSNQGINCSLSYDSAFILSPSNRAIKMAAEILTQLEAPRSAVISLREFNDLYPVDNDFFIKNIASLCKQLKQNNYQPVLLIQSHVSPHDTDQHTAIAIQQHCPEAKILNLFDYPSDIANWELLQAILKVSRLIIAVRYHTAVLALAAGRTPFNLFYSNKGADLSNRLGIAGCHVEQFNPAQFMTRIEQSGHKVFNPQPMIHSIQSTFQKSLEGFRCNNSKVDCYEHA